jgi:acetolactate synthase small subunit
MIKEKEELSHVEGFWNDNIKAQEIMRQISEAKDWVKVWEDTNAAVQDAVAFIELAEEEKDCQFFRSPKIIGSQR